MEKKKTILIADDHWVSIAGIKMFCNEVAPECKIIECQYLDKLFSILSETPIDLLILDVYFGEENSFSQLVQIRNLYPKLKILLSSMSSEEVYGYRGLKEGISGFISKGASANEYKEAISTVLNGGVYLTKKLQKLSAHVLFKGGSDWGNPFEKLSEREFQICTYFLSGLNISKIASLLEINSSTASSYKARAYEKLGINSDKEFYKLCDMYDFKTTLH